MGWRDDAYEAIDDLAIRLGWIERPANNRYGTLERIRRIEQTADYESRHAKEPKRQETARVVLGDIRRMRDAALDARAAALR